ncbi:hypothetical protein [Sporosarcina sp. BI001-red]|uniref:hypothetical protein n=1 Tax=Sporosarcina sp. BI001-red TaxID=2282866 RepID=UPI0013147203|nr:hypothetical protein [Sporosarcina sp. BI001-red]
MSRYRETSLGVGEIVRGDGETRWSVGETTRNVGQSIIGVGQLTFTQPVPSPNKRSASN